MVADHLSRLRYEDLEEAEELPIDDSFPDEYLLDLSLVPWYADFVNFLVCRVLPLNMSY